MYFDRVSEGAPDPIFGMLSSFEADPRPHKISLMVGIFKDDHLKSELLPVVRLAKTKILNTDEMADYLPIDGLAEFSQSVGSLLFGQKNWQEGQGRIYVMQAPGGTGALRVGAEFLAREVGKKVYLPHPSWGNHKNIYEQAGFAVESVPYYNKQIHRFDAEAYLQALDTLPPQSVVVFHAACHNPTGSDPTLEEWKQIIEICKRRSLIPFLDAAYQGFGDGIEEDATAVRLFFESGLDFLVAYSCSKNFSLYCQRVGALFVVCSNPAVKSRVGSQIKRIVRSCYSNPPAHGANIVLHILKTPALEWEWRKQVDQMRRRISLAREALLQRLQAKAKKVDFSFIKQHKGMFSYLDLTKAQTQQLIDQYAIYTLDSGRLNVAGITFANVDVIANSILAVCEP